MTHPHDNDVPKGNYPPPSPWNFESFKILLDERDAAHREALKLQAAEYERRLHDLNGEYQRDKRRQQDYVLSDKFEQYVAASDEKRVDALAHVNERFEQYARTADEKRDLALTRVNEKFDDYIRRYELRQREIDNLLIAGETAARTAKEFAADAARKMNRNLVIAGLIITFVIGIAQVLGGH